MAGLIAIVGRPNVGKSALFNRIAGRRIAIVHDMPGVTRDRVSAEVEWKGLPFTLVDTGGLGLVRGETSKDEIIKAAMEQVQIAIDAADAIIFVVDVRDGIVPLDQEVALRLRECGRPVLLAVNKVDTEKMEADGADFAELGFDEIFNVSAIQARGMEYLMKCALEFLPGEVEKWAPAKGAVQQEELDRIKLAIVGRPNVGKSSIINTITNSDRVVVSTIPGTTRDAVDIPFEVDTEGHKQKYMLIDTAGLRKSRRVKDSVEFFSTKRTEQAIERAHITVFVIDAETGIVEQDKKIADKITSKSHPCILVINKWDLFSGAVEKAYDKETKRRRSKKREDMDGAKKLASIQEFAGWVQKKLFFLDYAPVIFTSAKTGFNLERLLEAVRYVADQLKQKIPTSILNRTIRDAMEKNQPVGAKGSYLKFFYATQVRQSPPTFVLFMNKQEFFTDAYTKYLKKEIRKAFGYEGCPIVLVTKARPKKVDSIRTARKPRSKPGKPPLERSVKESPEKPEKAARKPRPKVKTVGRKLPQKLKKAARKVAKKAANIAARRKLAKRRKA